MNPPVISIIIPTHNAEESIATAVESILFQTFTDFEILIVDGASTDGTISIVSNYAKRDKRVKYISETDRGIYDAMNKGAQLSMGKWLYFLGADDCLINKNVLMQVFTCLKKSAKTEFFYGNVIWRGTGKIYDGKFDITKILVSNICHQAIFIKKQIFEKFGPFNLNFKTCADWDFNIKVFLNRRNIIYRDIVIADYNTVGYSSANDDIPFEIQLSKINDEYYKVFINRARKKFNYYLKRVEYYSTRLKSNIVR